MRKFLLLIMPLCLFGNYLLRIDINSKNAVPFLNSLSITAVDYFAGSILALGDEIGLRRLNEQRVPYEIIDAKPSTGFYLMVWVCDEPSKTELSNIGRIVLERDDICLLKVPDDSAIEKLNRLRVELKRLNFNPLIITGVEPRFLNIIKDSLIQELTDKVSSDTIFAVVKRLQNFQTRYSSTDSARACAQWLMNKFINYEFDSVYTETFSLDYGPNVIAIKKGMVHPDQSYVVGCGHYDCTSDSALFFAPGADDNGSGTSAVIEAARVLKDYLFEYSIRLICFCGEEQGLLGSDYYAQQAWSKGDSVIGAINLDMFAYTAPDRDTLTIINDTSYIDNLWLANLFSVCADTYTTLKHKVWTGLRPFSDHASFSYYGYHAVQGRENLSVYNPFYHTIGDTIGGGFNTLPMCYQGVRSAVASIATLAIPYRTKIEEERTITVRNLGLDIISIIKIGQRFKIRYVAPHMGRVKFRICNALGQIEMSWMSKIDDRGITETVIVDKFTPGVYFVRAETEDEAVTRKIIVLR